MKNLNSYKEEDFKRCPYHSEICSANSDDLVYRKAYKGDWGHWDDLPETTVPDQNDYAAIENDDAVNI
ncbi:hypothetical protein [Flavobacterium araucananum]|jgi:hypothetical protein|uniref:Uncharacterized protein n=1 Tax=Flavobacterium araucananum TaxID=946678 RepID=A0A227PJ86_9FLAO|nr:hypothetical protein [Flavobacterium araucananum]OXG09176.1 hypothetical protein B0A64_04050 [Flavobacterium araucananum]